MLLLLLPQASRARGNIYKMQHIKQIRLARRRALCARFRLSGAVVVVAWPEIREYVNCGGVWGGGVEYQTII